MSKIALTPNANGSGVFTLASPNSNTNRTITLPDESVTLGAGTPSIDDNGNATAITIDSSENVLVGKASANSNSAGIELHSNDIIKVTRSGGATGYFNRQTSDGNILELAKDGTTVGSIGANSNRLQIQSGSGGDLILGTGSNADAYRLSDAVFYPSVGDATADLGLSNRRFKDAYLSGGIYLGGVGSANKLDDYEEGTWNPLITGSGNSIVSGTAVGRYVKIGETVFVWMTLNNNGSNTFGSSVITFSGLPFTSQSSSSGNPVPLTTPVFYRFVTPPSGANQLVTYISGTYNHLELYWSSSGNWQQFTGSHINNDASFALYVGAIYRTNS